MFCLLLLSFNNFAQTQIKAAYMTPSKLKTLSHKIWVI